jgi:hypothetical protein
MTCPAGVRDCWCSVQTADLIPPDPVDVATAYHREYAIPKDRPPAWALWLLALTTGVAFWVMLVSLVVVALT